MNPNLERNFRVLLADILKCPQKNRSKIAYEMSEYLGLKGKQAITACRLDSFTRTASEGHVARFPAVWIPAVQEATGDARLSRFLLPEHLQRALTLGELAEIKVRKPRKARKPTRS